MTKPLVLILLAESLHARLLVVFASLGVASALGEIPLLLWRHQGEEQNGTVVNFDRLHRKSEVLSVPTQSLRTAPACFLISECHRLNAAIRSASVDSRKRFSNAPP